MPIWIHGLYSKKNRIKVTVVPYVKASSAFVVNFNKNRICTLSWSPQYPALLPLSNLWRAEYGKNLETEGFQTHLPGLMPESKHKLCWDRLLFGE